MRMRRRFSQNFLTDNNVIEHIVSAIAPKSNQSLIEIGPGYGALTSAVLAVAQPLFAIEIDRDCVADLRQQFSDESTFQIIEQDVLTVDFSTLPLSTPLRIFGNLPYNITSPLLFHLCQYKNLIQDMHFMLQKEVVDRITAKPGNKTYGRLSVMIQYHCQAHALFEIPPTAFKPQPKVISSIIRLQPHAQSPYDQCDVKRLELIVRTAFNQRRKTLQNSLKKLIPTDAITNCNIDPTTRPEQLSVADYVALANYK